MPSSSSLIALLFMLFFESRWQEGPAQALAAAAVYGALFVYSLKAMLASAHRHPSGG